MTRPTADFAALLRNERELRKAIARLESRLDKVENEIAANERTVDTGELDKRSLIYVAIRDSFSLADLRMFAFSLGVDYEELEGDTKGEKCMHLALYMQRRGRWAEFLGALANERPKVNWKVFE